MLICVVYIAGVRLVQKCPVQKCACMAVHVHLVGLQSRQKQTAPLPGLLLPLTK